MSLLNTLSYLFLSGFFLELLIQIIFKKVGKGFSVRYFWIRIFKGRGNLSPILSTGKIIISIIMVYLIYQFGWPILEGELSNWVDSLSTIKQFFFFLFSLSAFIFWTAKVFLDRKWENKWVFIPGLIGVVSFLVVFV